MFCFLFLQAILTGRHLTGLSFILQHEHTHVQSWKTIVRDKDDGSCNRWSVPRKPWSQLHGVRLWSHEETEGTENWGKFSNMLGTAYLLSTWKLCVLRRTGAVLEAKSGHSTHWFDLVFSVYFTLLDINWKN